VQKEAMGWVPDGRLLVCGADAVPHTMPNPGVLGTSGVGRQSVLRFLPSGGKKVLA